jgi:integrase
VQAVKGFKYLYLRKVTFYVRVKVPKRLGAREVRLCLRTNKLSSAVIRLETLLPLISSLKQLVIRSRTLDTKLTCLQFLQIKDAMLKQLEISDIDPMIAKLEQDYSDKGHTLNALSHDSLLGLTDNFKEQYLYIAQAKNNEQRLVRFSEVVAGLTQEQKWPFLESFSTVIKAMSFVESDNFDNNEGLIDQATQLLNAHGYSIDPNSLPYRVLLSKLKASNEVRDELLSSIFGGDSIGERELKALLGSAPTPTVQQVTAPIHVEPESTAPLFSEVYEKFLEFKINKEKLKLKMQQDYERRHAVWLEVVEDKPIDLYRPKDIGQFIDICFELPKMHILPYKKMTWQERLACDVPEEDLAAPKSVHQYYKWIMGVFAYAKRDTVAYIETSPCTIKRNFTANVRGVFSGEELRTLLKAAKKDRTSWKKWIIYLGIYTGARRGELAQLRKSDIKLDKETGRYYILFTDEHENQKLKTDNSKRKIPVHTSLVKAGFIDYVNSCQERVFDEIKNPNQVTAWMPRHMEKLNIERINELGHMRSFHSIRHTFITKCMSEPNININLLQQIVGHEISSFGIISNYTHRVTDIKNLIPIIDQFEV